jgi:hypothetical protein
MVMCGAAGLKEEKCIDEREESGMSRTETYWTSSEAGMSGAFSSGSL